MMWYPPKHPARKRIVMFLKWHFNRLFACPLKPANFCTQDVMIWFDDLKLLTVTGIVLKLEGNHMKGLCTTKDYDWSWPDTTENHICANRAYVRHVERIMEEQLLEL